MQNEKKIKGVSYAKWGYIFILPFFLTYAIFSLIPLVDTIRNSFYEFYYSGLKAIGPNWVGSWNNYFIPALVITSKSKQTLPIMIATLRGADYMNFDTGKIYMMITIAIVPIIIIYLLLSKFIVEGVTLGGVKE